ncbi:hypothetical protein ACLKA6_010255 [Drosophila palustris]
MQAVGQTMGWKHSDIVELLWLVELEVELLFSASKLYIGSAGSNPLGGYTHALRICFNAAAVERTAEDAAG